SQNLQRDGIHQMQVPKGRVNYEPSSLDPNSPRENPAMGFTSFPEEMTEAKIRKRAETFADHYSQARLFFRSMTEPEQQHIVSALGFELGKLEHPHVRTRMLGHLANIDFNLSQQVEEALGMKGKAEEIEPAVPPRDLKESPALSIIKKAPTTLQGRKIGVLITDGFDAGLLAALRGAAKAEKAQAAVIAPKVGGAKDDSGQMTPADFAMSAAPSIFFDALVILASEEEADYLSTQSGPVDWVRNAFGHLKVIGHTAGVQPLFDRAGVELDQGIIELGGKESVRDFIKTAKKGRIWSREPKLRSPG
ncbi:MAG: catalase-related domain-containing protein, partial [Halobacteriota archaeon]